MVKKDQTEIKSLGNLAKDMHPQEPEQLLESYRKLLDEMVDGVSLFDLDGKVLYHNPAFISMHDHNFLSDEIGRDNPLSASYLDGTPVPCEQLPRQRVLRGEAFNGYELQLQTKGNGRQITASYSGKLLRDTSGSPIFGMITLRDITTQKQAENSLMENEKKYRSLFDNMSEAFALSEVVRDADGEPVDFRYIDVNQAFEREIALTRAQILGKTPKELFPKIDPHRFTTYLRVARTGEPVQFESYSVDMDRWYQTYVYCARPNQVVFIVTDITRRKRIDRNRAFMAEIQEDLMHEYDPDVLMQTVGDKIKHYFGASRLAFVDVDEAANLVTGVYDQHEEGLEAALGKDSLENYATPKLLKRLRTSSMIIINDVTTDPRTNKQTEAYARWGVRALVLAPVVRDDKLSFIIAIQHSQPYEWNSGEVELLRSLAERIYPRLESARHRVAIQESEDKFKYLFDHAVIAKSITWPDGRFEPNRALCNMLGYEEEELISKTWEEITHPDDLALTSRSLAPLYTGNTNSVRFTKRYIHRDGSVVWADVTTFTRLDNEGQTQYTVTSLVDITPQKRAEVERERLLAERTAAMEGMAEALYLSDLDGKVIYHNPASRALHGYHARHEDGLEAYDDASEQWDIRYLNGQPVPVEDWPRERSLKGQDFTGYELLVRRVDTGKEFIGSYSGRLVHDTDGNPLFTMITIRDITEAKKAEAERERMLAERTAVMEKMADALAIIDPQGNIIYHNPASLALHGYSSPEEGRMTVDQLIRQWEIRDLDGNPVAMQKRPWQRLLRSETYNGYELRTRRRDTGKAFIGSYSGRMVYGSSGEPLFGMLVIRDITVQKQIEEALAASERKYRELVAYAPSGIYEIDFRTHRFIEVNDAMTRMTGFSREELMQMVPSDLLDEQGRAQFQERMRQWLSGEPPGKNIEYRVKKKDGQEIYVILNSTFTRDANGRPLGATVVAHDITERKQAEEALQQSEEQARQHLAELETIYESAPVGLCVFDTNLRYLRLNQHMAEINGLSVEAHLGRTPHEIVPDLGDQAEGMLQQVLETGEPLLDIEVSGTTAAKPGVLRFYNESWTPVKDCTGAITGISVVAEEITERKRAEEALRESENKFFTLFNKSSFATALITLSTGAIADVNEALEKTFGFKRDELIGKTALELGMNPDEALRGRILAGLQETGKAYVPEERLWTKSGECRLFINSMQVVEIAGEKFVLSSMQDITEQKQAETALLESEEKYRSLFDNMSEGFALHEVILDPDGNPCDYRFLELNDKFEELTGIPRHEALEKTIKELLPDIEDYWIQVYGRVALTGEPVEFDNYSAPLGKWFQSHAFSPRKNQFAVVFIDITERKQTEEALQRSEAMLRAVLEQMPSGVSIRDAHTGDVILVNSRSHAIMGGLADNLSTLATQYRVRRMDGRLYNAGELPMERAIAAGEVVVGEEMVVERSDGTQVTINASTAPILDSKGQIQYGVVVFDDISERVKSEEDLRRSEEKYRSLFESIDEGFTVVEMLFDQNDRPVDYRFLEVNPAFERQSGIQTEKALGQSMRQIAPEHEEFWFEIYGKVALTGEPVRFQNFAKQFNRYFDVYSFRVGEPEERKVAVLFTDITERKQAETALRESEERLRLAARAARFGIYDSNLVSGTLYWSPELKEIFGLPPDSHEPPPGSAPRFVHPEDQDKVREMFRSAYDPAGEGEVYDEHRIVRPDGKIRWVQVVGKVYFTGEGADRKPVRSRGMMLDITERKQAEEALRLSEERFRLSVVIAPTIFAHSDRNLRYRWVYNPHPDFREQDAIGKRDDEMEDSEGVRTLAALKQRVLETGAGIRKEVTFERSDGIHTYDITLEPLLDREGQVEGVVSAAYDISERVAAARALAAAHTQVEEERNRLQVIMDTLPGGIAILNAQGTEIHTNHAFDKAWGGPSPELHGVKDFSAFKAWWADSGEPVQPEEWAASLALQKGETTVGQVMEIERFDGSRGFIFNSAAPLFDQQGQISGCVVAALDISEQKLAEEALAAAHATAEQERSRLQAVLLSLPVGVAIVDAQGGIIQANRNYKDIWGNPIPRTDSVEDYEAFKAWWSESGERVQPEQWAAAQAVQKGIAVLRQQLQIQRFDGRKAFVLNSAIPIFDDQGNITGSAVAIMDITDQKYVEEALRIARDELELRVEERTAELAAATAAEQSQRQFAEALGAAALLLNQSLKQEEVLKTILQEIEPVIPYRSAVVGLVEGDSYYRASIHGVNSSGTIPAGDPVHYPLEHFPLLKGMILSRQPLLINETREEPGWILTEEFGWCRSFLSAPLVVNEQVIGFLNLFADQPGFFTEEMREHLVAFAAHAAAAIRNAELYEQVRVSSARLQSLARRLVDIQESERRYIARELHDEAGQMLSFMLLDLGMLEKKVEQPDVVLHKLEEMKNTLNDILENLHRVAMALRPVSLDHLGLVSALRAHIETIDSRNEIKVNFKASGVDDRLPGEMETALYRVVQEALTNSIRHANAKHADVVLNARDGKLIVIIEDDGVGFDPSAGVSGHRLGLVGMQERAEMIGGHLIIESSPGQGTTIMIEVAYPPASTPDINED